MSNELGGTFLYTVVPMIVLSGSVGSEKGGKFEWFKKEYLRGDRWVLGHKHT
jgi:hypothetical protein